MRADNLALLTARELEIRVKQLRQLADQVEAVFAESTAAFEATEATRTSARERRLPWAAR